MAQAKAHVCKQLCDNVVAVEGPAGLCEARESDIKQNSISVFDLHANSTCEIDQYSKERYTSCPTDGAAASLTLLAPEQSRNAELHDQLQRWCLWLGMTSTACEEWRKLHVNPLVAACYLVGSLAVLHFTLIWVVIGMADFRVLYVYVCKTPLIIYLTYGMLCDVVFWRYGPALLEHKLYPALVSLTTILILPSLIMGYVGPIGAVPFHNRLYYMCLSTVAVFCSSHTNTAGGSPADRPSQPRTSILKAFMRGTVRAVQMVDALTDVAVIRTFLEQKASGCWWFGEEGNCQAWTWLTVVFSILSCTKLLLSLSLLFSGSGNSGQSKRMQRLVFASDIGAMICEVGVGCCTLLQIFSLRKRGAQSGTDQSELNSQIALGLVSLTFTCAGLIIMLLGATVALRMVMVMVSTVVAPSRLSRQGRGSKTMSEGANQAVPDGRSSTCNNGLHLGQQFVPVEDDGNEERFNAKNIDP